MSKLSRDDRDMVETLKASERTLRRRANAIVTEGGPASYHVSTALLIIGALAGAAAEVIEESAATG